MALTFKFKKKSHGVTWKSGHMYKFSYSPYNQDPTPQILYCYTTEGIHPRTGHQHRYHSGINISYLPRKIRKKFVEDWRKEFSKNKNMKITLTNLKRKYPYLEEFFRRYNIKPNYYIRNVQEIPPEDWEKEVVKSWHKDFSATIRKKIASKLKRFFTGNR